MTREALEALAARCEQAKRPSIGLDRDIGKATGIGGRPIRIRGQALTEWPDFTASVDAALTLVPEGPWWSVQRYPCGEGYLASVGNDDERRGATPALAITAAALRAHAAREDK